MGDIEYQEALKTWKKEYKDNGVSQGRFPYLPVLDDILSRENIQTEQNMGLMQIPLDFVVGTRRKEERILLQPILCRSSMRIQSLHSNGPRCPMHR